MTASISDVFADGTGAEDDYVVGGGHFNGGRGSELAIKKGESKATNATKYTNCENGLMGVGWKWIVSISWLAIDGDTNHITQSG